MYLGEALGAQKRLGGHSAPSAFTAADEIKLRLESHRTARVEVRRVVAPERSLIRAPTHLSRGGSAGLTATSPPTLFDPRTSVFLCGSGRSLLNWVAYALVADHPGGFLWGHVRLEGELLDDSDPLKTPLIPRERLILVQPRDLMRDEFAGNLAVGGLVRSEKPDDSVRSFADFLRLPAQTQEMISRIPPGEPRPVLVLSGAHRLGALYPLETVGPTVRSIVELGGSMLMVWADAPVAGRLEFERILHVQGDEPAKWREAVLTVERGWPTGPLRSGAEVRLRDVAPIASVLEKNL